MDLKRLLGRIQQELSALLSARSAVFWQGREGIHVAMPPDGRWLEVREHRLPDGRQAFQAVEYPGQQSMIGAGWQVLAWIQARISI